ncbi:hypothetical protein CDAR_175581 [Caerostris darwini]|uniref:Uncharacterized protein n=1 Tax=Caerostris darwini TaxID=1538125 RepID=A0AAV4RV32_9ARAC|nr:hypothetical protein CDAR_175581 [Caerostris darwini]
MLRGIYTTHVKKRGDDALSDQTNVVTSDVVRYATCLPLQESSFSYRTGLICFHSHIISNLGLQRQRKWISVWFLIVNRVMRFLLLPPGALLRVVSGCKVRALFGIQLVAMLFDITSR